MNTNCYYYSIHTQHSTLYWDTISSARLNCKWLPPSPPSLSSKATTHKALQSENPFLHLWNKYWRESENHNNSNASTYTHWLYTEITVSPLAFAESTPFSLTLLRTASISPLAQFPVKRPIGDRLWAHQHTSGSSSSFLYWLENRQSENIKLKKKKKTKKKAIIYDGVSSLELVLLWDATKQTPIESWWPE